MTDYQYQNGNLLMMIRDTGTNVEFWLMPDQYTFNHDQPYSYVANGASHSGTADIEPSAWTRCAYINVTTDQTVSFTVTDTGLGFPTHTFSQAIDRASAPSAPAKPVLTVRSSTTIELDLGADGANNGAAIDSRQYAGSSVNAVPATGYHTASNNYQWTGLVAGTTYYFWERTHNSKGYSPWSAVASAKTWNVPTAPSIPTISNVTDTTVDIAFTDGANNGQAIDTREIGYGTSSTAPTTSVTSDGSTTITGLTPGAVYYFWARTHNSVGWSAYSSRVTTTTKRPPDAPTTPALSEITMTSIHAKFAANGDGGSPITGYEIGYGTDPSAPQVYSAASLTNNDLVLTGLIPGTTYYIWGSVLNAYGWGPLSATPAKVRTVAGAKVLVGTTWKDAVPYVNVSGVWKPAQSWAKIAGVWKVTT